LPRILTPTQFTNIQDDRYGSHVYDFPTMEMLLEIAKENKLIWRVKVEYKDLDTSSFSKITHIINPRTNQWEATDCQSRGKKALNVSPSLRELGLAPKTLEELKREVEAERLQGELNGNTNIN
jgi:hypothetical protein